MTSPSLARFMEKSGDDGIAPHEHAESNEHGFMTYDLLRDDDAFLIVQCFGDGPYWDSRAVDLARELGLKRIRFATRRSPRSFERKFNYRVVGYILEKEV